MARKTKAEQQREVEQAQADLWDDFVRQYPARFARVLYEYAYKQHEGFRVAFYEETGKYRFLVDNDDAELWADRVLMPSLEAVSFADQTDVIYTLECIEGCLMSMQQYKDRVAEQYQKRAQALAKLTKEEKELLGV